MTVRVFAWLPNTKPAMVRLDGSTLYYKTTMYLTKKKFWTCGGKAEASWARIVFPHFEKHNMACGKYM